MKQFKIYGAVAAVLGGLVATPAVIAQVVKIDGSSTVFPVTEAVAEDFQKAKKGAIKVTVGISGTGGGFKKFCRGETDISNASRPILKSEMEDCKKAGIEYIELPVAFDALTVMVNPKNSFVKSMTVEELKKIWEPGAQGKVTRWNQVNPAWPDAPLKLFGAGSDSGTFDYFTEAIVGKAKSSRGDYTASEDDNVLVQGISRDVNALGYFGYAYYVENKDKLKAVPIVDKPGKPAVEPVRRRCIDGQLPASLATDLHLREHEGPREARRERVRGVLLEARREALEGGQVRPATRLKLHRGSAAAYKRAERYSVRRARRRRGEGRRPVLPPVAN